MEMEINNMSGTYYTSNITYIHSYNMEVHIIHHALHVYVCVCVCVYVYMICTFGTGGLHHVCHIHVCECVPDTGDFLASCRPPQTFTCCKSYNTTTNNSQKKKKIIFITCNSLLN